MLKRVGGVHPTCRTCCSPFEMARPSSRCSTRDLENTVAFLQGEHARTLDGLHAQIHQLQQKCANLTFELAMRGGTQHNSGSCGAAQGDHLLKEMEDELCESKAEILAVRAELSMKNDKIVDLECQLTEAHENISAVAGAKEELVQVVQAKADTVANLMTQLHKEKQKSRKLMEQLKLLSDPAAPDHHTSNLRRMAASTKSIDITKYPTSHPTSSVVSPGHATPPSTPPLRRMPHPPTTPSMSSAKHVRRASTPSKQSPSPQSRQTSVHRRLPTVSPKEGGEVEGKEVGVMIADDMPNAGRRCGQDLNPLKQVSVEEIPGYTEIMRKEEPDITPVPTQQRQLSILPPIDGASTVTGEAEESSEFVLHHQISKRGQRRLIGSARIAVVDQAPVGGQQAWMSQLHPQRESNCK